MSGKHIVANVRAELAQGQVVTCYDNYVYPDQSDSYDDNDADDRP